MCFGVYVQNNCRSKKAQHRKRWWRQSTWVNSITHYHRTDLTFFLISAQQTSTRRAKWEYDQQFLSAARMYSFLLSRAHRYSLFRIRERNAKQPWKYSPTYLVVSGRDAMVSLASLEMNEQAKLDEREEDLSFSFSRSFFLSLVFYRILVHGGLFFLSLCLRRQEQ